MIYHNILKYSVLLSLLDDSDYLPAPDNCDQDVVDTLCITDYVLCEMKKDFPDLQTLYQKSDNAGCYAWNSITEIEYSYIKNMI